MASSMTDVQWIEAVEREYLAKFIENGGASVKFVVCLDGVDRHAIRESLKTSADKASYLWVAVDAAETRLNFLEHVFFAVARQVPWRALAQSMLQDAASQVKMKSPEPGDGEFLDRLALANFINVEHAAQTLRPALGRRVLARKDLAREFRSAMLHLASAEFSSGVDGDATRSAILAWLTGEERRVTSVRPYGILSPVNRSNARHLLQSTVRWLSTIEHKGLVLWLDISRISEAQRRGDGAIHYTRANVLDAYEVLRQFIDSVDESKNLLIIVSASPGFLDEEESGRGFGCYPALRNRVIDDVSDSELANPLGALVRIRKGGTP